MAQKAITEIKKWYPAIYARLSDEDSRAGVSLSIEHQLEILRRFVKDNGWHSPKVFYEIITLYLIQSHFACLLCVTAKLPIKQGF
jgi:hypothetical protein